MIEKQKAIAGFMNENASAYKMCSFNGEIYYATKNENDRHIIMVENNEKLEINSIDKNELFIEID